MATKRKGLLLLAQIWIIWAQFNHLTISFLGVCKFCNKSNRKFLRFFNFAFFRLFGRLKEKMRKYATFPYFRLRVKLYRTKYTNTQNIRTLQSIQSRILVSWGYVYGPPKIAFFHNCKIVTQMAVKCKPDISRSNYF